jgi:hypothetical protein
MIDANDFHSSFLMKLTLYLDNELPKDAEQAFVEELKKDPRFEHLLQREKSFKEFLRQHIARRKASPDLVKSLKDKIFQSPTQSRHF